jgi:hypothetical protein
MKPQNEFVGFLKLLDEAGADFAIIGLDDLVRNKRAAGRPKDLRDIEELA